MIYILVFGVLLMISIVADISYKMGRYDGVMDYKDELEKKEKEDSDEHI